MRNERCLFCEGEVDHAYHDNQEINQAHAFDVGEPPTHDPTVEWTQQRRDDYAEGYEFAQTEALAIEEDKAAYVRSAPRIIEARGPRHPSSQKFHDILTQLGELHDLKQKDYGSDNDPFKNVRNSGDFGVPAWIGCMVRANDKMKRIQTASSQVLDGGDVVMANESVEDSFMDLAVYAVIGLVLYRETYGSADKG